jgi:hypothetical protein
MTRWFRVYNDLVDDPKVQRLDPTLFKALINTPSQGNMNSTHETPAQPLRPTNGRAI